MSALNSFKELDVDGMFNLKGENDKIVDFSIGSTSGKPSVGDR